MSSSAAAAVQLTRLGHPLQDLEFQQPKIEKAPDGTINVILQGQLDSDSSLLIQNQHVEVDDQGDFQFSLPISAPQTEIAIREVGIYGKVKKEKAQILVSADEFSQPETQAKPPKRFSEYVGLGVTALNVTQTGLSNFSETALTLKGNISYRTPSPRWTLGISGYLNVLPISSNEASIDARYLGLNLRAGYLLTPKSQRWKAVISAGWYYVTSFVTNNVFGPVNMQGAEIYPNFSYRLSPEGAPERAIVGYFKFAPVSNGFDPLGLSSHEIAAGAGYQFPWKNHSWAVTLDYASLSLDINSIQSTTQSWTLGLSCAF